MNKYTIYCTPSQAKKALVLGAPLYKLSMSVNDSHLRDKSIRVEEKNELIDYAIPTAEQMIGWLEDGLLEEVHIEQDIDGMWSYIIYRNGNDLFGISNLYPSRNEATLAAIDAALEYLTNNKKGL